MRRSLTALALLGVLIVASPARAVPIVNTIPGQKSAIGVNNTQFLAAEFTLDQAFTLTQIQGWMSGTGDATLVILQGGTLPAGAPLFEFEFSIANANANWAGLSTVDAGLFLDAGSYWLAFEGTSLASGLMPTGAEKPLPNEAFSLSAGNVWKDLGDFGFAGLGIRISGDPATTPVPEPDSLLLLLASLAAIRLVRRRPA